MSNDLITFHFNDVSLNAIEIAGDPWFILADLCQILDLGTPHKVASRLDEDQKGRNSIPTLGGAQEMTIINESGLYALLMTSRKPQAKPFQKWVTAEVIPTIRKTGKYAIHQEPHQGQGLNEREQRLTKEVVQLQSRLLQAERSVTEFNEQIEINNTIKRMIATGLDDQTIAKAMETTLPFVAHCRIRYAEQVSA